MSDERKRDSERARELEAETREIQQSTTQRARKRLQSIDSTVDPAIAELLRTYVTGEDKDDSAMAPDAVLVVCFDAGLLNAMASALSSDTCIIYRASDGLEALNKLAGLSKCDCIVLDLALPSFVSGRAFIRFLDETQFASTPLVVVETPPPPIVQRTKGLVSYVPKPVDKGRLIATVRSLIEPRRPSKAP